MFLFAEFGSLEISLPKISTFPEVILTNDDIIPMTVDLPAPFGPRKAKKSPFLIERLILSSALNPFL